MKKQLDKYERNTIEFPQFLEDNEFLKVRLTTQAMEFIICRLRPRTNDFDFSVRHHVPIEKFILSQNMTIQLQTMLNFLYYHYDKQKQRNDL